MIWTPWSDLQCEPRGADLTPRDEERRAPGLHLGRIIHRMKVAAGENVGDIPGDQPFVRMEEGFLWETALEYVIAGMPMDEAIELAFKRYMCALRSNVVKQIALEKDGIQMTPDGLDTANGVLESYKHTRKKLPATQEDFEAKFWPWMVQEKAYALCAGVDTVLWIVLFAAGDYSRGIGSGPRMVQCQAVFTVEELMDNWRTVLKHSEGMR